MSRWSRLLILQLTAGIALSLLLATGLARFGRSRPAPAPGRPPALRETAPESAGPRLDIYSFHYDACRGDEKIITVTADRFSLRKRKIGFFRLGLLREAVIHNGRLAIHTRSGSALPETETGPQGYGARSTGRAGQAFGDPLSIEALPMPPGGKLTALTIRPVQVELHGPDNTVSRISAGSAEIRLRDRSIRFSGRVRMISGSRTLTARQAILIPGQGVIRATGGVTLRTPRRRWHGPRLILNLDLDP